MGLVWFSEIHVFARGLFTAMAEPFKYQFVVGASVHSYWIGGGLGFELKRLCPPGPKTLSLSIAN